MKTYYPIEILHWAGMNDGCLEDLKQVVQAIPEYINICTSNQYKDNALMIAARLGNIAIVKYLIENTTIDLNYISPEGNVLNVAVQAQNTEIVHYLIEQTSLSREVLSKTGKSIYHLAAANGDSDLIEYFLEQKISIKKEDIRGRHCLFDYMQNYAMHQNYWGFEVILENMENDYLFKRDKNNLTIIQEVEDKQSKMKSIHQQGIYEPLKMILNSRLVNIT